MPDDPRPVRPSPMVGETVELDHAFFDGAFVPDLVVEGPPLGLVRGCCPVCGATSGDEACWDPDDGYREGCPISHE